MEVVSNLVLGFATALTGTNLFYCFLGVFLGTFIGVLPGVGSLAAVSMLLPISFYLEPTTALVMLAGVYYGAEYGGSTASILLNLPGTPSSAVTCLDGNPMAKQGRAGVALFVTTIASFVGGTVGIFALVVFAPFLSTLAIAFGPAEYFAIIVFGLVAAAAVTQGSALKGITMVVLGLILGSVGSDLHSGLPRFILGHQELYEGFNIVALAMGIFGVAEVIDSINRSYGDRIREKISLRSMLPGRDDVRRCAPAILRGTGIGGLFGVLPGTGHAISSFVSYATEKRLASDSSRFGKGAIEGVAAPEASNNAAVQTAFIPTLTIGIPGSAPMALLLGALMIHGIAPGPSFMSDHPSVFWGLVASFWIGNVLLLVLNIPLIGLWVRLLQVPYRFLYPAIICLICIGVFSVSNSVFDVGLVLLFGVIGYAMRLLGFEPAPLLIGFVLGPLLEEHLRRALLVSRGDPMIFLEGPISLVFLSATMLLLFWSAWSGLRRSRNAR